MDRQSAIEPIIPLFKIYSVTLFSKKIQEFKPVNQNNWRWEQKRDSSRFLFHLSVYRTLYRKLLDKVPERKILRCVSRAEESGGLGSFAPAFRAKESGNSGGGVLPLGFRQDTPYRSSSWKRLIVPKGRSLARNKGRFGRIKLFRAFSHPQLEF